MVWYQLAGILLAVHLRTEHWPWNRTVSDHRWRIGYPVLLRLMAAILLHRKGRSSSCHDLECRRLFLVHGGQRHLVGD